MLLYHPPLPLRRKANKRWKICTYAALMSVIPPFSTNFQHFHHFFDLFLALYFPKITQTADKSSSCNSSTHILTYIFKWDINRGYSISNRGFRAKILNFAIFGFFRGANRQKWLFFKNIFWFMFLTLKPTLIEGSNIDLKIDPIFDLIQPTPSLSLGFITSNKRQFKGQAILEI